MISSSPTSPRLIPFALLAILAILLLRSAAAAQPVEIARVDWGVNGQPVAEKWGPVTLWIRSPDRPFSGVLTCTFQQDGSQPAMFVTPVATTPGVTTPVELTLPLTNQLAELKFNFIAQGARPITYTASSIPTGRELQLPGIHRSSPQLWAAAGTSLSRLQSLRPTDPADPATLQGARPNPIGFESDGELVLPHESDASVQGPPSSGPSSRNPWGFRASQDRPRLPPSDFNFPWHQFELEEVSHARLPVSWPAYDSAAVVILPSDIGVGRDDSNGEPIREGAIDAMIAWLHAGGRVVLVLEPAGDAFTRFLAAEPALRGITAAERERVHAVDDLRLTAPDTATDFPARVISLDDRAIEAGWSIRWATDHALCGPRLPPADAPSAASDAPRHGLIASGPVGLGLLTIIGFDPARTGTVESTDHTLAVWQRVLLPTVDTLPYRLDTTGDDWQYYGAGSGGTRSHVSAIASSLEALVRVPPLDERSGYYIGAAILLFGLLVGPIDRLVSRRWRLGPYAWLTTFGWVAIAGVVAFVTPNIIRSGDSIVTRLVIADVLPPAAQGAQPRVWRCGVTALWGGRPVQIPLDPAHPDTRGSSWWRGVSPVAGSGVPRSIASPVTTRQVAPAIDALRDNDLSFIEMRQWTFRALLDQTAPDPARPIPQRSQDWLANLTASWEPAAESAPPTLNLRGLPPDSRISKATLTTNSGRFEFAADASSAIGPDGATKINLRPDAPMAVTLGAIPDAVTSVSEAHKDPQLFLPGPLERTAAFHERIRSGRSALLILRLINMPPDLDYGSAAEVTETHVVVRLLIDRPAGLPFEPRPSP